MMTRRKPSVVKPKQPPSVVGFRSQGHGASGSITIQKPTQDKSIAPAADPTAELSDQVDDDIPDNEVIVRQSQEGRIDRLNKSNEVKHQDKMRKLYEELVGVLEGHGCKLEGATRPALLQYTIAELKRMQDEIGHLKDRVNEQSELLRRLQPQPYSLPPGSFPLVEAGRYGAPQRVFDTMLYDNDTMSVDPLGSGCSREPDPISNWMNFPS